MKNFIKILVLPTLLVILWFFISYFKLVNAYFIPSPQKVASSFVSLLFSGKLALHISISLFRVFSGFLMAFIFAFLLVLFLYFFPRFRIYCQFFLDFLRHIPPLAVLSLLVLWLGIGEASKIWIVFMAAFFPLFVNIETGIFQCDPKLIEVGRIANFTPKTMFFRIVLPSAIPSVIAGMNLGLSYAWRSLIGAELVAASSGIGYMILDARELSRPDVIIVGIVCLGFVGAVIDWLFFTLVRRIPSLRSL